MTKETRTFRQNTSFINKVSFKSETFIPTLLQDFDAYFFERFTFNLKIRFSFGNQFFIEAKSLSLEDSFQVCKQVVVAESQIWRIRQMVKQFKVQFVELCHCCDRLVTRCIVLVKEHFFLLYLRLFSRYFLLQMHQQRHIIFAIDGSSFLKVIHE